MEDFGGGSVIEVRGVRRVFGRTVAVDGLDLGIEAGELYGFLGPNGAGKTTSMRMLNGLLRPTEGSIRIGGHDFATRQGARAIRAMSGFVPDTPPLYDFLTGRQYIGFVASLYGVPPAQRDAESERLADAFGLTPRLDEVSKGYSHGMRKKLHLIAVLACRSRVLFLDEPTTGLDPRSARTLKDLLQEFCDEGGTVMLSTHVLDTAEKICHRVGILDDGRLKAEGTVEELRASLQSGTLEDIFLRLTDDREVPPVPAAETDVEPAQG